MDDQIVLALSGGAWRRNHLAEYGYWLTAGRRILVLAQVIVGKFEHRIRLVFSVPERSEASRAEEQLTKLTTAARVKAKLKIVSGGNRWPGCVSVCQAPRPS